jgi:hypothetical protein
VVPHVGKYSCTVSILGTASKGTQVCHRNIFDIYPVPTIIGLNINLAKFSIFVAWVHIKHALKIYIYSLTRNKNIFICLEGKFQNPA